jgi:Ribbon-helix-helix protein, copG family
VHRTQIMLTDEQYARLRGESARSGRSLAELIRRSVEEHYGSEPAPDRTRQLDRAFGGWAGRSEDGAAYVERIRSGTARRLGEAR